MLPSNMEFGLEDVPLILCGQTFLHINILHVQFPRREACSLVRRGLNTSQVVPYIPINRHASNY